mmetsp:Transcript_63725/g.161368  ORF Transcript_63725/g.161368 Transcript_63725/m.161368 type:complete len:779 (+) Transcript_63725:66-2402(+)
MAARCPAVRLIFTVVCLTALGELGSATPTATAALGPAPPPQSAGTAGLAQKWSLWPFGGGEEEEHYDCADNDKASVLGWSEAKLRWCCQRDAGVGGASCPPPEGAGEGDDLKSGEQHSEKGDSFDCGTAPSVWSDVKRDYCCLHEHRGCRHVETAEKHSDGEASSGPGKHFDCVAGFAHWQKLWSEAKRKDCCARFERGCKEAAEAPTTTESPATTTNPFDCQADFKNWVTGWSVKKKQWCCQTVGRGCNHVKLKAQDSDVPSGDSEKEIHGVSSKTSYDCLSDAWNWVKGWSVAKKDWCCTKHGLGCASADTAAADASRPSASDQPAAFDCDAEYTSWESNWSHLKKEWCCKRHGRGCPVQGESHEERPTAAAAAQGAGGPANADASNIECEGRQDTWTDSQRKFCCRKAGVECDEVSGDSDASQSEARSTEAISTSSEKPKPEPHPTYVARTTSLPYDCDHAYVTWRSSWSNGKKAWCCLRDGRGCPSDYDCDSGYSEWQKEWTVSQKKWCCKHLHRGCASGNAEPGQPANVDEGDPAEDAEQEEKKSGTEKEQTSEKKDSKPEVPKKDLHREETEGGDAEGEDDSQEADTTTTAEPKRRSSSTVEQAGPKDTTTTFAPYDCAAAFGSWEKTWSTPKKHWCCEHRGKGCSKQTHGDKSDLERYDCDEDFDDWITKWGKAKRAWCCMNKPALAGHAMCFVAEGKFQAQAAGEPSANTSAGERLGDALTCLALLGGVSLATCLFVVGRFQRSKQYATRTIAYANVAPEPILAAGECME